MSRWKLIRLQFKRGGAHFGELGIGLEETSERIRSDTLFSAWLSSYARLFTAPEVAVLVERIQQPQPLFRLSSTFIYQQLQGKWIDYLPRPLRLPQGYPVSEDFPFAKAFKKLRYLPLRLWQRWYQGEGFTQADADALLEVAQGRSPRGLTEIGIFNYSQAFTTQKLPKVAIDRTTRATNFYHTGVTSYRWQEEQGEIHSLSGLYFLVEFPTDDVAFDQMFLAVLEFLGDQGIGGERSSGAGQFKVDAEDLPADWSEVIRDRDQAQYALISLLWQSELSPEMLTRASYEYQERGGWITSSGSHAQQRRKSIQMLTEGSVFSAKPTGALADVTPLNFKLHRVYRSGIAMSLPVI